MTHRTLEAIEIGAGDGVVLRGQQWSGGPAWAILLHDRGDNEDLDRWRPLAPLLAERGSTVLAVDLRGHGASDGEWSAASAEADLAAVLLYARERGAAHLCVVAAGASATTALRVAFSGQIDSLVLLSPLLPSDSELTELRGAGESKLIFVGGADPNARRRAERLRNASIGWALLVNLPTQDQGTALLYGEWVQHVRDHVARFLAEQRFLAKRRHTPQADLDSTLVGKPSTPYRTEANGKER